VTNKERLRDGIYYKHSQLLSVNDRRWDGPSCVFNRDSIVEQLLAAPLPIKISFECPTGDGIDTLVKGISQFNGVRIKTFIETKKREGKFKADATYLRDVKAQAKRMNLHNKRRNTMEKDGAKYRTYTIVKALYNLKKEGVDCKIDDIEKATAEERCRIVLKFIVGEGCKNCGLGKSSNVEGKCSMCKKDWNNKGPVSYFGDLNGKMKKYNKLYELPITLQELKDNLPIYLGKLPDHAINGWTMPEMKKERKRIAKKKWFNPDKTTQGRRLGDVNTKGMSPSELVLHRRRLADAARMEEKDMDAMSPSQLALHRRRLTHGARVSPVLAALMDEIEQAQRNY